MRRASADRSSVIRLNSGCGCAMTRPDSALQVCLRRIQFVLRENVCLSLITELELVDRIDGIIVLHGSVIVQRICLNDRPGAIPAVGNFDASG